MKKAISSTILLFFSAVSTPVLKHVVSYCFSLQVCRISTPLRSLATLGFNNFVIEQINLLRANLTTVDNICFPHGEVFLEAWILTNRLINKYLEHNSFASRTIQFINCLVLDEFVYSRLFASACVRALHRRSVPWIIAASLKDGESPFFLWAIQVWCVRASCPFYSAAEVNFYLFCPLLS